MRDSSDQRAEPAFLPFNRKYLGSKRLLRGWICGAIASAAGSPASFLDGFCGTGSVALEMAGRGSGRVIAVDNLESNCVILRGFAAASRGFPERSRVDELLAELNGLTPLDGYVTAGFAGSYFTRENCMRMDAARERIAEMKAGGEVSPPAHDYLLASFLLAADRVANTLGQYDAFLKNIAAEGRPGGRHLVDDRVRSPFRLRRLAAPAGCGIEVLTGDMLELLPSLPVEAAYFDPPYNGRQYCDNYHVLENLARWERPPLHGKTRKFDRATLRSSFSRRAGAAPALAALAASVKAHHVFVSYSSEGIIPIGEVKRILSVHGKVTVIERLYPVFGNGAGVSRRRSVTEYLFHLRREEGGLGGRHA